MKNENKLREVLQLYRDHLPEGTLENFRIDPLDCLGIPVVDATLFTDGGSDCFNGVGYGSTEVEAQIGAFGELYEGYHITQKVRSLPVETNSYRTLHKKYSGNVIDPRTLILPAGSSYTIDTPLKWMQVYRLSDHQPYWIPQEFVGSRNGDVGYPEALITPITNGVGAGDTFERALLHGLLEFLQRDGNCDSFRALDKGKVLRLENIDSETQELLDLLKSKGLEVTLKLARVTCGCVSVYAVGRDLTDEDFPLSVAACGEAADPDYNRALRKAILECASSHSRKLFYHSSFDRKCQVTPEGYRDRNTKALHLDAEEQRALQEMVSWITSDKAYIQSLIEDTVFSKREEIPTTTLPSFPKEDIPSRLQKVLEGYQAEGLEIYYMRATPEDHPIQVVRTIVPGIEMELGSYHRIGYRGVRRLQNCGSPLVSRKSGSGKERIILTPEQEEAVGGPVWLDGKKLDQKIGNLYPLYREPSGHAAPYAVETAYFSEVAAL